MAVYGSWTVPSSPSDNIVVATVSALAFIDRPDPVVADLIIDPPIYVARRTASGGAVDMSGVLITLAFDPESIVWALNGALEVETNHNGVAQFDDVSVSGDGDLYLRATSSGLDDAVTRISVQAPNRPAVQRVSALSEGLHEMDPGAQEPDPGPVVSSAASVETPSAVDLGAATGYAVLADVVTSTGSTVVNGDLGVASAGATSGFPPGLINGETHPGDPVAAAARADLTVDAAGDPDAVFIFETDADFDVTAGSSITLTNGAPGETAPEPTPAAPSPEPAAVLSDSSTAESTATPATTLTTDTTASTSTATSTATVTP